jgi:hypothetical protein
MNSRFRSLTILAAVAVPLALVMAPSVAVAKKTPKRVHVFLEGPINHPKDQGLTPGSNLCCFHTYTPMIQIEAKLGGTKAEKVTVTQYGLWGPCTGFHNSDGLSKHEFSYKPKKKGKPGSFSGTDIDAQFGHNTLTVSGRFVGRSSASGLVREVEERAFKEPAGGYAYGTCDSGTVSWTASRVPQLTDIG